MYVWCNVAVTCNFTHTHTASLAAQEASLRAVPLLQPQEPESPTHHPSKELQGDWEAPLLCPLSGEPLKCLVTNLENLEVELQIYHLETLARLSDPGLMG